MLKLREVELELSRVKTVPEAAKKTGLTKQTYSFGRRRSVAFAGDRRSV
jgi:hypothetical protein